MQYSTSTSTSDSDRDSTSASDSDSTSARDSVRKLEIIETFLCPDHL